MHPDAKHRLNRPILGYFTPKSLAESPDLRKHLVAAGGEFIGTYLFLFGEYTARYRCCPSMARIEVGVRSMLTTMLQYVGPSLESGCCLINKGNLYFIILGIGR